MKPLNSTVTVLFLYDHVTHNYSVDDKNCTSIDCIEYSDVYLTLSDILVAFILSSIIVIILIGNVLVVLSVCIYREMRKLSNALIASLATADLLVAVFVLPLSVHVELAGHQWFIELGLCDFWVTADVFCCSASILNIVVIAMDRYWLITKNVNYTHGSGFTRKPICVTMVCLAWIGAAVISTTPLFGWKVESDSSCVISQDLVYTLFSTTFAFWLPLALIVFIYAKLFRVARRRVKMRCRWQAARNAVLFTHTLLPATNNETAAFATAIDNTTPQRHSSSTNGSANGSLRRQMHTRLNRTAIMNSFRKKASNKSLDVGEGDCSKADQTVCYEPADKNATSSPLGKLVRRKSTTLSVTRMRNTARMLGLIIGGFVGCWLPFFLLATVVPFCKNCTVPHVVQSVVLWLGYSNSMMNPIIYAIWDKNFRRSFGKLIHCRLSASYR